MIELIYKCKNCGELKPKSKFVKSKSCKLGIRLICEKCEYEKRKDKRGNYNDEWYKKNREYRKEYSHKRRKKQDVKDRQYKTHKEWIENNSEWVNKHNEKLRNKYNTDNDYKEYIKGFMEKTINELPDHYIINRLIYCDGFTKEYLLENPEIIKIKRLILKTKRLCKTSKN